MDFLVIHLAMKFATFIEFKGLSLDPIVSQLSLVCTSHINFNIILPMQ
jgi:hypothetical protein